MHAEQRRSIDISCVCVIRVMYIFFKYLLGIFNVVGIYQSIFSFLKVHCHEYKDEFLNTVSINQILLIEEFAMLESSLSVSSFNKGS